MALSLQEQYDQIYRYCYFKVKDRQLAEDLTQETFLRLYSQPESGKPMAYVYTVARNLCVDYYRRAKEPLLLLDELGAEEPAAKPEPVELQITVKEAVAALPPELQELILLRFVNNLGIGQIAQVTGVSRFTVRRRMNSALAQLKSVLRKEDFT